MLNSETFLEALPLLEPLKSKSYPLFEALAKHAPGVLGTVSTTAKRVNYRCKQEKAWRTLMVSAINAGLHQKQFSLTIQGDPRPMAQPKFFDFKLPGGNAARGSVRELAYGELSIFAAMRPTGKALGTANAGLMAGDAYGAVWLERKSGAWVEPFIDSFACKENAMTQLSKCFPAPAGFGDAGEYSR